MPPVNHIIYIIGTTTTFSLYSTMKYRIKIVPILSLFFFMSVGWGCIDGVEVELWGECYNIEETTFINLNQSGLTGEIPPEIGNLTNLEILSLYDNHLTGEIPIEIGLLTSLTDLYLNTNQLTGEIPQTICELSGLIGLFDNQLCPPYPECCGCTNYVNYVVYRGH